MQVTDDRFMTVKFQTSPKLIKISVLDDSFQAFAPIKKERLGVLLKYQGLDLMEGFKT